MGQSQSSNNNNNKNDKNDKKKKYERPLPTTIGQKKRRRGPDTSEKIPTVFPNTACKLRQLKLDRINDFLLIEEEYLSICQMGETDKVQMEDDRKDVENIRGETMIIGELEEVIDDEHAIVSIPGHGEHYVTIMSFVDKEMLELSGSVILDDKIKYIVGVLDDDTNPIVSGMKIEKAPKETYADIGGLESQIQEMREAVELPLTHPQLYEDMGIKPPKGVILYGEPGTGKTLLAKAVASATSATFLRIVGSELIKKYAGEGPKLVRELFKLAEENAPSIIFIDEIDAVGTKRYDLLPVVRRKFKERCWNC